MAKIKTLNTVPSYDKAKMDTIQKTVRLPIKYVEFITRQNPDKTLSELIRQALWVQYIASTE